MTRTPRTFTLEVRPDIDGGYGITLQVRSNGAVDTTTHIDASRLDRLRPAVVAAVTASKHARTVLSPTRKAPIRLTDEAGVRLGLTAHAAAPLSKAGRVDAIRQGIDAMTNEEALYWYALCTGPNRNRALKALRTLLAEE